MADQHFQQFERSRFSIEPHLPEWLRVVRRPLGGIIDKALGFSSLTTRYHSLPSGLDPDEFAQAALAELGVSFHIDDRDRNLIPREGPCIIVANHPHGGLDGLLLMRLLMQIRSDIKFMANHFLAMFTELRPLFFKVDPFGGYGAVRYNIGAARAAVTWLKKDGLLVVFPGGEVSSLSVRERRIVDPDWDIGVARLAKQSGSPVTPLFISGRNSMLFQLGGLIDARIRTALLVREMLGQKGSVIDIKIGRPVSSDILTALNGRREITQYLRTKTYLLQARYKQRIALGRIADDNMSQDLILPSMDPALLAREIEQIPADQQLLSSGSYHVYYARSVQIPSLLQEIGRLRELSFREVGEGTGKTADIDLYDAYYLHLFVWDARSRQIVGGYRLGRADDILETYGPNGLYIHSLFKLSPGLMEDLRYRALEVGRSFVRPEYQRNYSSLMLLWKGISAYVARNPKYRILYGPVSISNDYHPVSQQILVQFLKHRNRETRRASQVKPRRPFRSKAQTMDQLVDLDSVDLRIIEDLLGAVEQDDKGVPVILRQYLKMGGHILGFNIDAAFNNAIDCLLWVDLMQTELPLLRKYMGTDGTARFRKFNESPKQRLSIAS